MSSFGRRPTSDWVAQARSLAADPDLSLERMVGFARSAPLVATTLLVRSAPLTLVTRLLDLFPELFFVQGESSCVLPRTAPLQAFVSRPDLDEQAVLRGRVSWLVSCARSIWRRWPKRRRS